MSEELIKIYYYFVCILYVIVIIVSDFVILGALVSFTYTNLNYYWKLVNYPSNRRFILLFLH